jgi:hypothetical protein
MSYLITEVKWGLILLEDSSICCFTVGVLTLWESRSVCHFFMHIPKNITLHLFLPSLTFVMINVVINVK